MPKIGLGTAQLIDPEQFVYLSLKKGMRLIDTASIYKKDKEIGTAINRAIHDGIVRREEIFLISKLWVEEKDCVVGAVERQLSQLNLDYIDLYLDHWPMQIFHRNNQKIKVPSHQVWESMEMLVKLGLVKSIGVSNYNVQRLHDLLSYASIPPTTLQVEMNPYFQQKNLKSFCIQNKISLMAYNSLCNGKYVNKFNPEFKKNLLEENIIKNMAKKYQKTPGQIVLNWAITQNIAVILSTNKEQRLSENLDVMTFSLEENDLEEIAKLDENIRCNDSSKWECFEGIDFFA